MSLLEVLPEWSSYDIRTNHVLHERTMSPGPQTSTMYVSRSTYITGVHRIHHTIAIIYTISCLAPEMSVRSVSSELAEANQRTHGVPYGAYPTQTPGTCGIVKFTTQRGSVIVPVPFRYRAVFLVQALQCCCTSGRTELRHMIIVHQTTLFSFGDA